MFNKVKNLKQFPSDWKTVIIYQIYKGMENGRKQVIIWEFRFYSS
jgi:hypothetical protein